MCVIGFIKITVMTLQYRPTGPLYPVHSTKKLTRWILLLTSFVLWAVTFGPALRALPASEEMAPD
eukprot:COSAG01_NODE_43_length_32320_cov_622.744763_4_plen_65_part_00